MNLKKFYSIFSFLPILLAVFISIPKPIYAWESEGTNYNSRPNKIDIIEKITIPDLQGGMCGSSYDPCNTLDSLGRWEDGQIHSAVFPCPNTCTKAMSSGETKIARISPDTSVPSIERGHYEVRNNKGVVELKGIYAVFASDNERYIVVDHNGTIFSLPMSKYSVFYTTGEWMTDPSHDGCTTCEHPGCPQVSHGADYDVHKFVYGKNYSKAPSALVNKAVVWN